MNSLLKLPVVLLLSIFACWSGSNLLASEGALTSKTLKRVRSSLQMDGPTRALYNAATNNQLPELVVNRAIIQGDNPHFSHTVKTKGITNQKASERCWLYAGLNALRPAVIKKYKLDRFEFSENYLAFWDKLEKANLYYEFMIEFADRDLLDREVEFFMRKPLPEGGWWEYVVALIEKYGVVPIEAMPESPNTEFSRNLFAVLHHKIRADAIALRKMKKGGKSPEELRTVKEKMLQEVYRMLVLSIGEPPQKFTWRYQKKKGKPSKPEILTPQQFYKKRIGIDLSQYVHLINDPTQPYQKHYRFDRSRNMIGGEDVHYINVEIDVLRDLAVKAICDNQPVLFGADARHDQDKIHGIMAVDIFDYQSLFGFDFRMSKAERMLTREITANHAMVFVGVDLVDGKPVKWRVENSWGKDLGKDGYWNLYDSWFDEYVFCLVVRKAYVPEKILERFDEEPIAMPPWHPLYELMR